MILPSAPRRNSYGDAVSQAASDLGRVHLHAAGAGGVAAAADGARASPLAPALGAVAGAAPSPATAVADDVAGDDDGGGDAAEIMDDDGEADAPRKKRVVTGTAEGDPREHLNMITIGHVDAGACAAVAAPVATAASSRSHAPRLRRAQRVAVALN